MQKFFWPLLLLFAASLILVDQLVKEIVVSNLSPGETLPFLGPLEITLVYNPDFAFGLSLAPEALKIPLVLSSLFALLLLLFFLPRNPWVLAVGSLILAGGLSNLWDRLSQGKIVDYLLVPYWPAFNLADTWVTIGFVLFVVYLLFFSPREVFRPRKKGD